ncbi:PilZ domain-containing protein [Methylobacterium oxalidis]|uniref:PilZ domain-containing protein n=1 Tax=Methylobacterium oxalidis TaxID=944322 RepID=UPI003314F711
MEDQRSEARRRALMPGKILLASGGAIDCVLRDRSASGARLNVVSVIGIPDAFTLVISTTGERRLARVAWRKQNEIGVGLSSV